MKIKKWFRLEDLNHFFCVLALHFLWNIQSCGEMLCISLDFVKYFLKTILQKPKFFYTPPFKRGSFMFIVIIVLHSLGFG